MKTFSFVTALAIAIGGAACASGTGTTGSAEAATGAAAVEPVSATIGAPAPGFTLPDASGQPVKLSDFAGKVVVLEWINPDCPFVVRHANAGTMKSLAQKYSGNVVWIGINSTNYMDSAANAKWIADRALPYTVLDDHTGAVGRAYNAKTTPHMYVIDTTGKLVYAGAIDDDNGGTKGASAVNYVDAALAEVTAGKPVSVAETKPYGCSVKYAK